MSSEIGEEVRKPAPEVASIEESAVYKVESELEVIFGCSGRQALLLELSKRYGVVLDDAIRRPGVFHSALYYLLGELGSRFVMARINTRIEGSVRVSPLVS